MPVNRAARTAAATGLAATRSATFREVFAEPEFRASRSPSCCPSPAIGWPGVAMTVLVYDRTRSALWAAVSYAVTLAPWLIGGLALPGLAGRRPRREVMAACDPARLVLVGAMVAAGRLLAGEAAATGQPRRNAVRGKILGDIATMIKDQMPSQNLIGRFTGDAFVPMFPDTGQDEARKISERLRDHIAGEPIAIEPGAQNGFIFRLAVSIGIAVLTGSRRALSELIGAAGTALAQPRSTGWNKVYVSAGAAGEDDPPGAR